MALIVPSSLVQPSSDSSGAMLGHLPEHQRHRILSGMRWTVWLSALAVPFSMAVNFLFARIGPEVLGVYGLLGVYVGLTSAFLFFGGDTVVMRFIPLCRPDDRASFLVSYLLVILAIMSGWLVVAWFCPGAIRLALGEAGGDRFHFIVLCLAVIPITFAMVVACMKGMLEIRDSQVLAKLLPILSFGIYAAIFVFDRSILSIHPTAIVWSVYLGLAAMLCIVGIVKIVRLCRAPRLRWFLPDGFWSYAFSTQQVSVTSFLARKLDYVLIVNVGGLKLLGEYVAVITVASTVPMISGFFMDTLLPALTNTVSARNHAGAAQVFTMHMRILFLIITAMSCAVMVSAFTATAVMGAKYASLGGLIIFMTAAYGIASPGAFGGTVLASIGRQQLAVWTQVFHLCLFVCLFFPLWWRWNLTGAVVAYGVAVAGSNAILMAIALKTARFLPPISGLWLKSAAAQAMVAFVALWWMPLGLTGAILIWLAAMVLFLWLADYDWSECKHLTRMFLPGSRMGMNTDPAEAVMKRDPQVVSS
jgi:O-antigen/teichoic acid export membrane protein